MNLSKNTSPDRVLHSVEIQNGTHIRGLARSFDGRIISAASQIPHSIWASTTCHISSCAHRRNFTFPGIRYPLAIRYASQMTIGIGRKCFSAQTWNFPREQEHLCQIPVTTRSLEWKVYCRYQAYYHRPLYLYTRKWLGI